MDFKKNDKLYPYWEKNWKILQPFSLPPSQHCSQTAMRYLGVGERSEVCIDLDTPKQKLFIIGTSLSEYIFQERKYSVLNLQKRKKKSFKQIKVPASNLRQSFKHLSASSTYCLFHFVLFRKVLRVISLSA